MRDRHKIFLSVIVPTKNNKKDILPVLLDIHQHLKNQPYRSEIIVVDDNSEDDTQEMVQRYQHLISNLKFINNRYSLGKDFTVRQAMLLAKGDWRLLLSPINYVSVVEFNKIISHSQKGFQVFKSYSEHFQCFSAKAAENIFSQNNNLLDFPIKQFIANTIKLC